MSPEYVSLLAIPEAAKSLVAVKSQTQFDSPSGAMAASPVYHRRKGSDIGNACTQDLSQRFEAQVSFLYFFMFRVGPLNQSTPTMIEMEFGRRLFAERFWNQSSKCWIR